jgi:hypothetical protein
VPLVVLGIRAEEKNSTRGILHGNGECNLCRNADGRYKCRQMLYCLLIPIPVKWRRGPLSRIIKN